RILPVGRPLLQLRKPPRTRRLGPRRTLLLLRLRLRRGHYPLHLALAVRLGAGAAAVTLPAAPLRPPRLVAAVPPADRSAGRRPRRRRRRPGWRRLENPRRGRLSGVFSSHRPRAGRAPVAAAAAAAEERLPRHLIR
ncbi:unnamed protein product, partial [Ectocarpus sp. 12 AP-2014]